MTFGKQSGYPASHRQVQQLTTLIEAVGHADFRDARGPLGLTQRQAAGKFTRDEADELIARLEAQTDADHEGGATASSSTAPPLTRREAERLATLEKMPDDVLAAELQRRGWIVVEP